MDDKYLVDVYVWNEKQNNPIIHRNAKTYEKGGMFCVYEPEKQVTYKYPISNIWRIRETYPDTIREHKEQ